MVIKQTLSDFDNHSTAITKTTFTFSSLLPPLLPITAFAKESAISAPNTAFHALPQVSNSLPLD